MSALPARLRAGWTAVTGTGAAAGVSLAVLVLASVFVAVAGARLSQTAPTSALRAGLRTVPTTDKAVLGDAGFGDSGMGDTGRLPAAQLGSYRTQLRGNLSQRVPLAPAATDWTGLTTGYSTVLAGGRRAWNGSTPPQLELAYRDALPSYAKHITGSLPAVSRGHDFQVAVTTATAQRFGVTVGSRLRLAPSLTLVVTGIIAPASPGSAFWAVDPAALAPTRYMPLTSPAYWLGAMFVGPGEVRALEASVDPGQIKLSWGFPLAVTGLTAAQSSGLHGHLSPGSLGQLGQLSLNPPVKVTLSAGLDRFLTAFARERDAVSGVLGLLVVSLAAIGIIVVVLGTLLLAERRRGEFELMRARGAARRQLSATALRASALAAIPAAVVATAVAFVVTPGAAGALPWWLAALTLAAALAGLPVIVTTRLRSPARRREAGGRAARRHGAVRRLVIEAALIAAAAGGLEVARQQGVAGAGQDVLTSAAPVLVAIPAGIVALRCYPLVARWLLRAAGMARGTVAYVGLARAARSSLIAILPAFALVLVLATISFGGLVRAAITRGEVAASWQQTGADAVIDTVSSSLPVTPAAQRALAAVPGVQRVAAITLTAGVRADGTQIAIAAVAPRQYSALIAATPGPRFPAAALARQAGPADGAAPAVATTAAVAALGGGTAALFIGSTGHTVRFRVVAAASAAPALAARAGPALIVVPNWAMHAGVQPPNLMLITGPRLDQGRLSAVAARLLPGGSVTFRSAALAGLARAPLPHAAYMAYAVGAAVAAGFGIAVLLVWLLLSARSRDAALARLAAMGLSARQRSWLILAEMMPEIVVVIAAGTGCAWALASLVGPDLSLAAFTGSGAAVQVRAEPVAMALAAAGLLFVAVATLAGQAIVTSRRGTARAVRMGE
ncbi:MAG TPA: FtsX-like permease family protein [Streptosporangiaceae bacterium]